MQLSCALDSCIRTRVTDALRARAILEQLHCVKGNRGGGKGLHRAGSPPEKVGSPGEHKLGEAPRSRLFQAINGIDRFS